MAVPEDMLRPGTVLGRYRVTGRLGGGGMADVYRAEHVLIGGQFAVKVLRSYSRESEVKRLFIEARVTAFLDHPGIVKTFDFGYSDDGCPYLVMEYLHGETLQERLAREKQISIIEALDYARQIANALKTAHEAGIIHRDLKPSNIILSGDTSFPSGQRARILDFGIAKDSMKPLDLEVTRTGTIIGTPHYMSPEQCRAQRNVDHRADFYALGCIVYRMLTGRPVFQRVSKRDIITCHVFAKPEEPNRLRPDIPPDVNALIMRLLAKKPSARFARATDLLAALNEITPTAALEHTIYSARTVSSPNINALPGAYSGDDLTGLTTTSSSIEALDEQVDLSPPFKRRLPAFALLLILALGGSMLGFRAELWSAVKPNQPATELAAVSGGQASNLLTTALLRIVPEPSEPIAAEDPAEPSAEQIRIVIDSEPAGADIYQMPQSVRLGQTPLELKSAPIAGELVLIVKKSGYRDARITARADRSDFYQEVLVPSARRGQAKRSKTNRAKNPAEPL